jgi:hypothetical protein
MTDSEMTWMFIGVFGGALAALILLTVLALMLGRAELRRFLTEVDVKLENIERLLVKRDRN